MLNPLAEKITAVRGNCEAEVDGMVLDFDCMQTYVETEVNGIPLILTNGHHYNKEKPFPKKERYVLLNGHFHVPEVTDRGAYVYLNDGSVSIPKQNSPHSYMILEEKTFTLKNLLTGEAYDAYTFKD